MSKKNILFIARDDGGCGFFRCKQPSNFLQRSGLAESKSTFDNTTEADILNADLVIMQNSGPVEGSNMAKFMIDNNVPFMTEFDDFIQHVSPHNHGGYSAWNPGTLFVSRAMDMARKGIGMTVSTNQLAREYFPYNDNIYVIPNYLDKDKWDIPILKKNDSKIRIGWCGGNAHADDLKMISKVLEKIVKEYEGKVIFETMGMTKNELHGVFPMESYDGNCPSCGYEGELHHFPGENLDDYMTVLASKGWDIALAPVINNSFGNAKSDLKIKEYSALGIPVVASPITPYIESARSGARILFAETFEEWYNMIKSLIEDSGKRDEISRHNKSWISNYWIQDNIEKIFKIYKQVIDRSEKYLGTKEDRIKQKK
jgi:glycosyltransferase involved in cell wall biosynthesis